MSRNAVAPTGVGSVVTSLPGRPTRVVVAAVLAVLAALALAGCTSATADDTTVTALAPGDRGAPIEIAGTTLDGAPLDLAGWRGKVVVVNFWASWCVTCRDEAAALEAMATALRPDGVQFVGIATRDTEANARSFLRTFPMSYPSLVDDPATNKFLLEFRHDLPVAGTPTTYVLDREGRVAARAVWAVDQARLREMVDPVLAEG